MFQHLQKPTRSGLKFIKYFFTSREPAHVLHYVIIIFFHGTFYSHFSSLTFQPPNHPTSFKNQFQTSLKTSFKIQFQKMFLLSSFFRKVLFCLRNNRFNSIILIRRHIDNQCYDWFFDDSEEGSKTAVVFKQYGRKFPGFLNYFRD